jgi:predicted MPP superfamily phosphohydrolase
VTLAGWHAKREFDLFRTNRVTLAIPNLPPQLQGLVIAHVSDIHIGKFSDDALLKAVVERTNALKPDLICYTGDLIDYDLADIPAGVAAMRKWDPRFGLCLCEGNHDLMTSRPEFEDAITQAGFPMPINGSHSITVRGQEIQLLGLRWGTSDLSNPNGGNSDADIADSVQSVIPQIRPGAFPILLAHHPHAFDYLGDANIPLTLAGHTHGGQINLGPIHPAALRFRYISGLYQKQNGKQLFVSNGVGNWFPLRIGAPAEIVEITLRGT